MIDLGHGRIAGGIDLGRAARDDDARARTLAPRPADGLAGLPLGLGRDGAGVDDDGVGQAGGAGMAPHHLGFEGVEPAAEGDDVGRPHTAPRASDSSSTPVKLVATGPVMRTWPSGSHSISSGPPSSTTSALRPVSPRRAAATRVAQAPVPQARVMPTPRSHTRMRIRVGDSTVAVSMLQRSGNSA